MYDSEAMTRLLRRIGSREVVTPGTPIDPAFSRLESVEEQAHLDRLNRF